MQRYIDSHCHVSESFPDMLARAEQNGMWGCVLNSVTESDWKKIIRFSNMYKNVHGAIGVHPWYAESMMPNDMDAILSDNLNLIVGEIGLDKTRDNFATQEKVFIRQLEIAIKYNRTVCLHCVHAWDIMLRILKIYKQDLPKIVAHAFDGTQNAIDFDGDLYFSYSPNVADKRFKRVVDSVMRVPKNKILVESDGTDLLGVKTSLDGVLSGRYDITPDDIFNNAMGVFFNG